MTPEQLNEARAVAGKLTAAGAKRALGAMTDEWQFCGKATFNANGAHSAFWQCGGYRNNGVVEAQPMRDGKHSRTAYRLTALGLAVRTILQEHPNG